MIGDLPAGVQPEHIQRVALLRRKIAEGGVRHVVGLQRKLVESGQKLGDRPDRLIRHIYAVGQRQGDYARIQAGPQSGFGYFVATGQFQFVQCLENC